MDKNYQIKGLNGQIILTKKRVKIARKGAMGFLTSGLAGVKEIPIKNISSIQMKEATNLTNGYLQFSLPGGIESKKGLFDATKDENTVMFTKKHQDDFLTVKKYIDAIIDEDEINFDELKLPLFEENKKNDNETNNISDKKEKKTFSWKYLIPIYGFYLIFKTDNAKKGLSYFLNILITIIVLAMFGGSESTNDNTGTQETKNISKTEQKNKIIEGEFSKKNYKKIKNGMSQAKVKKILGEPESTTESEMPSLGKTDMWHYQDTSLFSNSIEACQVYFTNGKVSMKNWTKL